MSEDFKLTKGQELVIKVPKKKRIIRRPRKVEPENDQGLLLTRKGDGYFPRRKRVMLTDINFYDLGQRKIGEDSYETLDFSYIPTIDLNMDGYPEGLIIFGLDQFQDLKNEIFSVGVGNLKDNYKKIGFDEGWRYGIDAFTGDVNAEELDNSKRYPVSKDGERYFINEYVTVVDDSKWTETGLQIPADDISYFSIISQAIALGFGTFGSSVKITATDNYAADAVEDFEFAARMEVYLMPCPVWVTATDITDASETNIAGLQFRIASRELFLTNSVIEDLLEIITGLPLNAFSYSFSAFPFNDLDTTLINYIRTLPDSRYYVGNTGISDVADFPINPLTNGHFFNFSTYSAVAFTAGVLQGRVQIQPGVLLAVIKKGSSYFYLWATDTYELDKGFSFRNAES